MNKKFFFVCARMCMCDENNGKQRTKAKLYIVTRIHTLKNMGKPYLLNEKRNNKKKNREKPK